MSIFALFFDFNSFLVRTCAVPRDMPKVSKYTPLHIHHTTRCFTQQLSKASSPESTCIATSVNTLSRSIRITQDFLPTFSCIRLAVAPIVHFSFLNSNFTLYVTFFLVLLSHTYNCLKYALKILITLTAWSKRSIVLHWVSFFLSKLTIALSKMNRFISIVIHHHHHHQRTDYYYYWPPAKRRDI